MRGPQDESIVAAQIAPRSEEGVVPQSLPGGKALVRVLQLLEAPGLRDSCRCGDRKCRAGRKSRIVLL
jgi:hypothetical protein